MLSYARSFCPANTNPFDTTDWKRVDVSIEDDKGETVFKQTGVEAPVGWSDMAVKIVANKYFYGSKEGQERESSVRGLIHRVANTIAKSGQSQGYFDEESTSNFYADLAWLILHQYGTFNSPVWFNVGLREKPQSSACLPYDARVNTTVGLIPIGEIVEYMASGRTFLTYDKEGNPTKILKGICNGKKLVRQVGLRTGDRLYATGDHVFFAQEVENSALEEKQVDQLRTDKDCLIESGTVMECGKYSKKLVPVDFVIDAGIVDVYDIQTECGSFWYEGYLVHNCFINSVEDNMGSIMDLAVREATIFKWGSGAGSNLSNIRSSKEKITGGGYSSGPVSFMEIYDRVANVVKSGGVCLAPWQRVYTIERGPVPVKELADSGEKFLCLSYDPPAKRYKVKWAEAYKSGRKKVYRVKTDKGQFDLSWDHPMKLSTGDYCKASELKPGMSLFSCCVTNIHGYLRVGLHDGKKGKESLHRLVAMDVLGEKLTPDVHVHHKDHNKHNNIPSNLEVQTAQEHTAGHGRELAEQGAHHFQHYKYPKVGANNPMHKDSAFWQDSARVEEYKALQGAILEESGRAVSMQEVAGTQRMVNLAFKVLNLGGNIDTFNDYIASRFNLIGRVPNVDKVRASIDRRFGSYEGFVQEVANQNHRVVSVEELGVENVYDVEVDCPTDDDKTRKSGHNFVVWSSNERHGTGVAISNTRRSAKLQALDMDHGDIVEFIECKTKEERKAKALIKAGYDSRINGEAYGSVFFQNSNLSVRISDAFMQAYLDNAEWWTKTRDGKPLQKHSAVDLMNKIAKSAWECGDPGVQFDDIIERYNTIRSSGRFRGTNPCSEFVHIDDTACNLASFNLLKFYDKSTRTFKVKEFKNAVTTFITAMDILVEMSGYPTTRIGELSHQYRPLGLGYANLGSLLMVSGLAYDSDAGRALAGAVTSLLGGAAYRRSAELARSRGAFQGLSVGENRTSMREVLQKHETSAGDLMNTEMPPMVASVANAGGFEWSEAVRMYENYGVRNSQATLLAPTGTIAFMMDCATTGVEPEIGLLKYKKLVGGGLLTMVNPHVQEALEALGYSGDVQKEILAYVKEHGMVEGCELVDDRDVPVFDCSMKSATGTRTISHFGHLKMMAAVQPFLSGAISKTCNISNSTTIDEIKQIYVEAWKMGLKCVALYRDGSKGIEPYSASKSSESSTTIEVEKAAVKIVEKIVEKPVRRKLPEDRKALTHKFSIVDGSTGGEHEGYLTVGLYEDGTPGEVFIRMNKEGSTVGGLMDSFAIMMSMALQHGVPLDSMVGKLRDTRFPPFGPTRAKNPALRFCTSVADYVAKYLQHNFVDRQPVEVPGTVQEVAQIKVAGKPATVVVGSGPACTNCGTLTNRDGKCHVCPNCGSTVGACS